MTIPVSCPNCGKVLHAKDSAAGKKAKCPDCGDIIKIPELDDLDDAEDAYDAEEVDNDDDGGFGDMDFGEEEAKMPKTSARKPCPACGEMIVKGAAKCRYCGEILDPKLKKLEKKRNRASASRSSSYSEELTGTDWFLCIFCSGIGCIVGVVRMIQGNPVGIKMVGLSILFDFLKSGIMMLIRAAAEN